MRSAHRALLQGKKSFLQDHETALDDAEAHSRDPREQLQQRIRQRYFQYHRSMAQRNKTLPATSAWHPHLPNGFEIGDRMIRALGVLLPLSWQNHCRDSGGFRSICDNLVTLSVPTLAIGSPRLASKFLKLSKQYRRFQYDEQHSLQYLDLFDPSDGNNDSSNDSHRLIYFVHGGAWGSGMPWMYRLVASSFVECGYSVAIIAYRTYPDGNTQSQVDDCAKGLSFLSSRFPGRYKKVTLMGHSSGAHVSLLYLIMRAISSPTVDHIEAKHQKIAIDSYVGISGPYDIDHHFDYEAGRGVEELSPMKPCNGYTREAFKINSPAVLLQTSMHELEDTAVGDFLPPMLFVHGIDDSTVPFTATAEAARNLRAIGLTNVSEVYIPETGHQDTVMHLMSSGKTCEIIHRWLLGVASNDFESATRPWSRL